MGLHFYEKIVEKLLTGIDDHGPSQTDEGVDGEEEALLLVRPGPEHQEPQVERGLGQGVREEEPCTWAGQLTLQHVPGPCLDGQHEQGHDEDKIEVQDPVDQVKLWWLSPVQVWSVGGEHVVPDNIQ